MIECYVFCIEEVRADFQVSVTVAKMQVNGGGERLFLGDPEDETSSMVNSSDDEGHGMLDNELASKVGVILKSLIYAVTSPFLLRLYKKALSRNSQLNLNIDVFGRIRLG